MGSVLLMSVLMRLGLKSMLAMTTKTAPA